MAKKEESIEKVEEELKESSEDEVSSEESEEKSEDLSEELESSEEESETKVDENSSDDMDRIDSYMFNVRKLVDSISFSVLNPKMVKTMAAAKVVTPELYDKEGYPVDGGIMDIRLGVIDPGLRCKTCGGKLKECLGHFGYIELARPIVHINFVNVILSVLRSTCRECGKILIPKDKITKTRNQINKIVNEGGLTAKKKLVKELIASYRKINKCPHCNVKQQTISLEKPSTFLENDKRISPIEIRARLEKVPDEDVELLGLNPQTMRPEWGILTILPIPPVTMRPSITLESGERSEDDLTHKLGDIVRINQRLFENINAGAPEIIIEDLWDLLQYHITTYFDNSVAQIPPARHRSGEPLKTITERIKSKEGRIRHNLAGKRTNFSARTVIGPDPMIGINEVGVPMEIAMKLTVPERITSWNMEYLKSFVEKGPKEYPGANYIIRPDGKKKKITEENKEQTLEEIQPGYIIERHLIDGDISLFNRQPSLHRMSMMCHRVRVLPGRTLRLNPTVCHPYNADFDGDEMNLHVLQTEEARAEAEILMEVQTQLISPRYGLSVIGCIQDGIGGNYILTRNLNELNKEEAVDLLMSINVDDFSKLPNKQKISGKEVFSVILPEDFNFIGKSKGKDLDGTDEVIIEKGKLIKGIMDRKNLGEGSGLLLRNMHQKYGPLTTIDILEKIFRLGIAVLTKYGFSTSISDTDMSETAQDEIQGVLNKAEEQVHQLIQLYESGELEVFPGRTMIETLELKILEVLNKTRNDAGNIVMANAQKETGTEVMASSGSRGNPLNLAQMTGCVGQQAMRGARIEKGFKSRTLSAFKKGDLGPKSHGFIRNSFKSGMKPYEFFFGAMTGRDSLMDTALRTPKSGYLYRRLSNAMQDLKVEYDGTVRNAAGSIIQFSYGDDGIDVSKSENGTINVQKIIDMV